MARNVALIVGSNGIVGLTLAQLLVPTGQWNVIGISRRPSPLGVQGKLLAVDLTDRDACFELGSDLEEVTHLFYCARATSANLLDEERVNFEMFSNILEATEANAPNLAHVQVMEGTKWYGCHLGPYKTPAREDDPRHFPPNFYFPQQDLVEAKQASAQWTWSALRPHIVWGITLGYPHSFVVLLAAYATLCRHLKLPLVFPGSEACFNSVSQATDAGLLARSMLWAATTPGSANNAFNIVNGDLFRWRYLWPKVAEFFDMEPGPVQTFRLADRVGDLEVAWREIADLYTLRSPFADLGNWAYFDFTLRFDSDDISITTKARRFGFDRFVDTEGALMDLFEELRALKVIP
jgi:nucleoside-diphosphate-sugar epimerase